MDRALPQDAPATLAQVFVLDNPQVIDRPYSYTVPAELARELRPGAFVTVPFGRNNRSHAGLVSAVETVTETADTENAEIKAIKALSCERLFLSEEQLALCFYLREQTLCTMGEAVRTVIPSSVMAKLTETYRAVPCKMTPELGGEASRVLSYLRASETVSAATLKRHFGPSVTETLKILTTAKLVEHQISIKEPTLPTEKRYTLACTREEAQAALSEVSPRASRLTSPKQKAVVKAFLDAEDEDASFTGAELMAASGAAKTQFDALVTKGILRVEVTDRRPEADGVNFVSGTGNRAPHVLSDEQSAALATLCALAQTGEAKAALLHGVTGSGKTCVMLEMIDRMLDRGKGVIVLLPEISLTPQMLSIFHARYGELVAVIHSGLSVGERQASHLRILSGEARVVVGTRSAVFAPVRALGMIVMDEEQEHTYKSDMNPKYHARDIARYRCAVNKALLLLASATPSLESYHKAMEGKYTLISMKKRYGQGGLPRVEIVDMRGEALLGNTTPLSHKLCENLTDTHGRGEQSVLFLNRRGYSTRLVCRSCGKAVSCPRCSVAMNHHTKGHDYDSGELICHWCGTRRTLPAECPDCGSPHLIRMGYGTQRVEQELGHLMPDARIMRMDADTTATKTAYHDLLGSFRRGEADVLLGTQMVTKGHDFPRVTLVGVLLADASLYLDDYRAAERTFSMLTQVIGRAGRGDTQGLAVIQTMNPDHDVIKLACKQDYETFYEGEIKLRRLLVFPPFCDIALLTLTSPDEKELQKTALRMAEELNRLCTEEFSDVPVVSFGPFEAPVYRVDSVYRMRMVVKCRLNKRSRALLLALLMKFSGGRSNHRRPVLSIDLNPSGI